MNYDYQNPQKVQLSYGQKMDADNNIIERSMLLNVRCPNEQEAVEVYRLLRLEMPEELGAYTVKRLQTKPQTFQIQERTNGYRQQPENEADNECPECGSRLVKKLCRKGPMTGQFFLACPRFPSCRFTQRIET